MPIGIASAAPVSTSTAARQAGTCPISGKPLALPGGALRYNHAMPRHAAPPATSDTTGALRADELRSTDYPAREFRATRRLVLRELAYRHVPDLLQLGRQERVTAFLLDSPLRTLQEVAAVIVWANRLYASQPALGLWHASDHRGFVGLFSLTPDASGEIGIGARLLPRAWGRGYALEGAVALCDHAFATLRLPRLAGICHPDNRSVPPLLARLGFRATGTCTQAGQTALRFELARDDWRGLRPRREGRAAPSAHDVAGADSCTVNSRACDNAPLTHNSNL